MASTFSVDFSLSIFTLPAGSVRTKALSMFHRSTGCPPWLIVSTHKIDYFRTRQNLITALIDAGIKILMVPPTEEWDGKSEYRSEHLREVEIEDLLPREKIEVDMEEIGRQLRDKVIMITGAAGSIGSIGVIIVNYGSGRGGGIPLPVGIIADSFR